MLEEVLTLARLYSGHGLEDPTQIKSSVLTFLKHISKVNSNKLPGLLIIHLGILQGLKYKTAKPKMWTVICYPCPDPEERAEGSISLK